MSNGWAEAMQEAEFHVVNTSTRFHVVSKLTDAGWRYVSRPRGYQNGVTIAEVYMRAAEVWK